MPHDFVARSGAGINNTPAAKQKGYTYLENLARTSSQAGDLILAVHRGDLGPNSHLERAFQVVVSSSTRPISSA